MFFGSRLFFFIIFSVTIFTSGHQPAFLFPNNFFVSENEPTNTFRKLFEYLGLEPKSLSLVDIVNATQRQWKRPDNTERWELDQKLADPVTAQLFKDLGLIDTVLPTRNKYDFAVIFGSTASTMRKSIAFLYSLYKSGVEFHEIIFLVGDRKRDPSVEDINVLKNEKNLDIPNRQLPLDFYKEMPTNETEIAKMLWNQADIGDLYNLTVRFVDTPATIADGVPKRPTTVDTVVKWKNEHDPKPGSKILAISRQPYLGRQDLIIRNELGSSYSIETVGFGKTDEIKESVFLDEIARSIYTFSAYNKSSTVNPFVHYTNK